MKENDEDKRVSTYTREKLQNDVRPYEQKFLEFIRMCDDAKRSHISKIMVASRWVIGDTTEERHQSLKLLAAAGLKLIVADEQYT